jgi:hypothetical protein
MNRLVAFLVVAALAVLIVPTVARTAPTAPTGLASVSLDGKVGLAWKTVSGATSYKVYRGATATSITTLVGTSATTSYTDSTAANGTTYYYAVKASASSGDSPSSSATLVKPLAKSCSTGSAVVQENCYPGSTSWRADAAGPVSSSSGNIEGFASATSVNQGGSVDLKVNTADNAPYRVEIYRMGYYGGAHARLVSTIPNLTGVDQDACQTGSGNTGLTDCSNWATSATITTSTSWPSGVYMMRLVRTDTGNDNNIVLVVRNDTSNSDVLYTLPTATYQAYNNYGGKSLYDFNSSGDTTVAATARAVKVSYDRPYSETYTTDPNWFGAEDVASVGFLENNGYDVSYATSTDLHTTGASLLSTHKSFVSPTHDEYWSSEMRNAVTTARNAGTGLFWMGSNQVYWKIRYESSPFSGTSNRVEVCYKTTASGATDPVSATGTWRDPAGANAPENGLVGQMYIGDNDQNMFKLGVSDTQGKNRIWRHTDMTSLPAGTSTTLGQKLVGWEWNDRVANGQEPANTQVWTSSTVNGELVQHNGRDYITGASATASGTTYQAASGAWVVSTGTNYWSRGLDNDGEGNGEANNIVQQATVNILSDMSSRPTTPIAGMVVDAAGAPTVSSRTPGPGDTGVPTDADLTATFTSSLDANSVTSSTFTLTTAGGSSVPATVSYSDATKTVTLNPANPLGANASYTAKLKGGTGGISGWGGTLAADVTWSFTTGSGTPPVVLSTTPNDGDGSTSVATTVKAVFDRDMTASTITSSSFTLTPQAGTAVAATVAYNAATDTATLTPTSALDPSRQYTATLTTAVKGGDGTALSATKSWSFTTAEALTITTKVPAALATGVSPGAIARAVFSRAVDPTTLTSSTFTLTPSGGSAISASVTYDATTSTASLTPSAALTLNKVYTAKVAATVKGADGSALGADVTWTFTTATSAPTAPTVVATSPVASATAVATDSAVTATFDRAMDATSITASSFVLKNPSGVALAATVSYDAPSQTARLVPTAALPSGTVLTATLTTAVRSSVGTPMAATKTWTFTSADCPCSMMGTALTPASTNLDVVDGRSGSGLTYELGTKFTVTKTMKLTAVRFYKDANETGTHVGRIWNSAGTQVASVTFAGESASGWQKGVLSSPLTLTANVNYTVSVGFNSRFTMTEGGLASPLVNGPLASVADGADGVLANAAGSFPTLSWHTSNYFVDAIVANPGTSNAPVLSSRSPVSGATGVDAATTVTATFAGSLDPGTVTSTTFSLATAGGTAVPASVSYNDTTKTATLTPTSPLSGATSYTAKLTTGLHSDDGTPLAAQTTWSFSTAAPSTVPAVTGTSPAASATGVSTTLPVSATFSTSLDPSTVTGTTFSLTTAGGATVPATVGYDDVTKTATLTPSAALTGGATYTATITTGVKSTTNTPMAATKTWSFTTSGCPCSTMSDLTPQYTNLDVRDGRGGAGPWTYEMGSKFTVSSAASLTGIRFYKDAGETGTHVGTLWNAAGGIVGQVTFGSETASGWQQASFSSPLAMTPGAVYTVSVGFNTRFVMTSYGLRYALTSGPLSSVADGQNGVYGLSSGTFPTGSWASSNYLVDAVVQ